ncbi:MAG: ribonuclease Z [Lactobacillaceae bacterium]|jgi:ribonuclease Z|nr:ribonuclease Z [Lactobacillaceae bacterium]
MEIQFLGTSAGQPTKFRNVSSIALKLLNEINQVWLFDVGEATQHQIIRTDVHSRKINKIFLSHLHGDHIFGLPGFLASRNFQASDNIDNGKPTELTIYSPAGVERFVRDSLEVSKTRLDYKINFVDVNPGVIFDDGKFKVTAYALKHPLPTFAYRIEEINVEGELDIQGLLKLGIQPGPIMGLIKKGEKVTLDDGTVINGQDFVFKREGRIITIVSDTKDTSIIEEAAQNADVLIHEATYASSQSLIAKKHGHSTSLQAAIHAKNANAKQLILTHISPRYVGKLEKELLLDAQDVFSNISVARDFSNYEVEQKEAKRG